MTVGWSALMVSLMAQAQPNGPQAAFFEALKAQCGARFVGETTFPDEPGEDWRDKVLVATLAHCDTGEIRIPLQVGENQSRTWVLRPVEGGLELKHDHRHADGTPDEVTNYGGTTHAMGTALSQAFPADAYTAELIPEAATNVWSITLSEDGGSLTYYLERHGKPRFEAVLVRQ